MLSWASISSQEAGSIILNPLGTSSSALPEILCNANVAVMIENIRISFTRKPQTFLVLIYD